jgi:hypothetical protein
MRVSLDKFAKTTLAVAVLMVSGACQIYPYWQQHYTNRSTAVTFEGCSPLPSEPITFQVTTHDDGSGAVALGPPATSDLNPDLTDSTGQKWYCWSANKVIPTNQWATVNPAYGTGAVTYVRVLTNGQAGWRYLNDPHQCTLGYGIPQITNEIPCAISVASGWTELIADAL